MGLLPFLVVGISLAAIGYAIYAFPRLEGDSQAQLGAVLIGLGGVVGVRGSVLVAGAIAALGCLLTFNVIPKTPLLESSERPSVVLGGLAMLAGLPLLYGGAFPFWLNVFLLVAGEPMEPIVFGLGAAGLLAGGLLFAYGFGKAAVPSFGSVAAAIALASAALTACWLPIYLGPAFAEGAVKRAAGAAAPAADAPSAPGPLVSTDKIITLDLPGWTSQPKAGTVLFAYKDQALVSISDAGAARERAELLASLEKSRADAAARGASMKGSVESRRLPGGGTMGWFRFDLGGSPCSLSELTTGGRSYSVFARGLDAEAQAALERSLEKL